jgi:hypothetical protein
VKSFAPRWPHVCVLFAACAGCGGEGNRDAPNDAGDAGDADGAPIDLMVPPHPRWSIRAGDGLSQAAYAAALADDGSVVVIGEIEGEVDLGSTKLVTAPSVTNGFVAKLDARGQAIWARRFGGEAGGYQSAHALARDAAGAIYVGGVFDHDLACGSETFTSEGSSDGFVARLDEAGSVVWCRVFPGVGHESITSLALTPAGSLVVAGEFSDVQVIPDGGAGVRLESAGTEDLFLAELDASGSLRWARRYGGPDDDRLPRVAVARDGTLAMAATYRATIDLGGGALPRHGDDGMFLAGLTAEGAHVFSEAFPSDRYQFPIGLAIDAAGSIVVGGRFASTVDFGGGVLVSVSGDDAFVASFTQGGAHRWSRRLGGEGPDSINGLVVDARGDLLVSGDFTTSLEGMTSAGGSDVFLAALSQAGVTRWTRRFGDPLDQHAFRLAIEERGPGPSIVAVGSFFGTLDLGSAGTLVSAGGPDPTAGDLFVVAF